MDIGVGEVAKRAGVKVSAIHFYEQKGLISSWRNPGNQRRFHRSVLRRIAVIKAAQQVGLSLEDISQALEHLPKHQAPSKKQWEEMASAWHEMLDRKIRGLQALQNDLGGCIGCGCLSLETCALRNPQDQYGQDHQGESWLTK
ncbi:Redox-sensitive transcriptional activator soxR [Vibrio nigripulchritudo SFn27]|uniref:Redox-sensitive transcriptional activator SoxR n=1 Tax=Vibrio nigripulchritudo TaxID=28173 RepID=U4KFZ0_9VIBR|nr:redox-sensitive transcriptional activator SoxR [Vibrio nigripulchritudo]CCN81093.1 Redox-sensitive transcriptional activator soxR [Vibrio nigripulchritudo BLFn1]CCN86545.1 Redox-sensitive transcriptional activator soxR [Vibrio nigripulchritudo SFn27]CCN92880.1 Redox-sensitive transcriptional activator soxR [Vibrio nigripulchritudo ENn2]CCO40161.1 Redox-sensitive transcriptional activator soxR [Vibrio nigripulchritudo SFn135]CCO52374.1 Redox-sensitive transcriptional activator soxR [Vibrio n